MAEVVVTFFHHKLSKRLVEVFILKGLFELRSSFDSGPLRFRDFPIVLILLFLLLLLPSKDVATSKNLGELGIRILQIAHKVAGSGIRFVRISFVDLIKLE